MAEAIALHVVVLHLAHALDPQRLPRQILAGAPAALAAGHAARSPAHRRRPTRATDDRRARRSRSGASSSTSSCARRHRERRGHADVMQPPAIVVQPEQQRADARPCPLLCQRKPATTQSAVRACLILIIARLPGWYGAVCRLGDDAVEPGAFEPREPLGRHARDRASPASGGAGGSTPASTRSSSGAPLALRQRPQIPAAERQQSRTRRTTPASPARAWRPATPPGCRRSCSASKSSPRGVAITISPSSTQPSGSCVEQRVVQLGKVAIERPQVAALDVHLGAAAKDDRAEAVPLRLVQEAVAGGKLVGELREHRLDRRREDEGHHQAQGDGPKAQARAYCLRSVAACPTADRRITSGDPARSIESGFL